MQQKFYGENIQLGMIGGGQLGRMFIQEAINFDVQVHVLDGDAQAPCALIAHSFTHGDINNFDALYQFGLDKDILTVEIENVNIEALEALEKLGKKIFPQPRVLKIIKDKGVQKQFYLDHHLPTSAFKFINQPSDLLSETSFLPFVQKLRTGGYDGKGVQAMKQESDFAKAFDAPSIIEAFVPFEKEISVIVARNEKGEMISYPSVECEFNEEANLVELLFAPAKIDPTTEEAAQKLAKKVIEALDMVGILAVEMFLTKDGSLLINEIAPRPHNSGHHTIECNVTSQFEQHLRSVLNLPLGSTKIIQAGAMINLLGEKGYQGAVVYENLDEILSWEGVHPHIYGKKSTKDFRKMGHVTIAGNELEQVIQKAKLVLSTLKVKA